ncbi:hypothetical protein [Nitrosomonas sp. HPC101]|uniref:hypothetical protein n=1 Tax=Nitrosomonas sp. HPC101 TaxID=1658667 RepID=UPI00136C48B5|nr:hypothetical protein [Nitrosomonas sp. HPC101]
MTRLGFPAQDTKARVYCDVNLYTVQVLAPNSPPVSASMRLRARSPWRIVYHRCVLDLHSGRHIISTSSNRYRSVKLIRCRVSLQSLSL